MIEWYSNSNFVTKWESLPYYFWAFYSELSCTWALQAISAWQKILPTFFIFDECNWKCNCKMQNSADIGGIWITYLSGMHASACTLIVRLSNYKGFRSIFLPVLYLCFQLPYFMWKWKIYLVYINNKPKMMVLVLSYAKNIGTR